MTITFGYSQWCYSVALVKYRWGMLWLTKLTALQADMGSVNGQISWCSY